MKAARVAWLAAVLAGCVDQATAPGVCPAFCPSGRIDVVDTVLAASIARDSAYRGYVFPYQAVAMTASAVPGVLDSRVVFVTAALPNRASLNTSDTTTSPLVGSDSAKVTLTVTRRDTSAHNLTLRLYGLPVTIDSNTTFGDVQGAFAASPLRSVNLDSLLAKPNGVDVTTGDSAGIDTTSKRLKVTLKLDSVQAPYVLGDSGKLGIGVGVGADGPTSVSFCTRDNGCGAAIAWFMKVDSIKGTDTTLIHKSYPRGSIFDTFLFDPPPAPLDSPLVVGGAPSARSILRITLPRAIRDSSQIIRATLLLLPAVPARGAPVDSFVVEAHTVAADFGAKSPLILDATRTDTTMIRVGRTDTVRIEITNLMQFWVSDTTRPEVLMLRSQEEATRPTEIRFYPSAATPKRPALRITYARRFPFGVP
jgi:hypothetical protein